MKVLQINCVYEYGSTGKIVSSLHESMISSGIDSIVCYGRKDTYEDKQVIKVCTDFYGKVNNLISRINGLMYGGCLVSTIKIMKLIKKHSPDIVHVHCVNGYFVNIYKLIAWLKKENIFTVLTLHAEFMYTANCSHAFDCQKWKKRCGHCSRFRTETKSIFFDRTEKSFDKMRLAFDGFDEHLVVVSVSPWLMKRAKESMILGNKAHKMVFNGIDTSIFYKRNTCNQNINNHIKNKKVILHVTASFSDDIDDNKGGRFVFELANRMSDKQVIFLVAGKCGNIKTKMDNVLILGEINDKKELAELYSIADITLLTSKRETFSMVCAESLCCGTPVVGFKAGAPEEIAIEKYSEFVDYGNIEELEMSVGQWLYKEHNKILISELAKNKYSKEKMIEQYLSIYEELLK